MCGITSTVMYILVQEIMYKILNKNIFSLKNYEWWVLQQCWSCVVFMLLSRRCRGWSGGHIYILHVYSSRCRSTWPDHHCTQHGSAFGCTCTSSLIFLKFNQIFCNLVHDCNNVWYYLDCDVYLVQEIMHKILNKNIFVWRIMSGRYCSNVDRVLFLDCCREPCRGWSGSHIVDTWCSHSTWPDRHCRESCQCQPASFSCGSNWQHFSFTEK